MRVRHGFTELPSPPPATARSKRREGSTSATAARSSETEKEDLSDCVHAGEDHRPATDSSRRTSSKRGRRMLCPRCCGRVVLRRFVPRAGGGKAGAGDGTLTGAYTGPIGLEPHGLEGASVQTTKDASTSKAPEPSKGPVEKKKRKVPEKRKAKPSKRPTKRSKKAPESSTTATEVMVEETSTVHVPPVESGDREQEVKTSIPTTLPRIEESQVEDQTANEPVVLSMAEEMHHEPSDDNDVLLLDPKIVKRKKPEPSSPSTHVPLLPLRKPQPLPELSSFWSTSTDESSEGEDDSDDAAGSIQQEIQVAIPYQLTEEIVLPIREVEENEDQVVQAEDPSSTLPQQPANVEEMENVIEAEEVGQFDSKDKGRGIDEEITDPKEQDRVDKAMIEKAKAISRIQSSFRDVRHGVGTSRANDQSTRPPTNAPNEEAFDDSSDSSTSNDSGDDHNNNQGVSNPPQNEEELRMIAVEDTHLEDHHHVSMEGDDQADHHILSSPREDDESRDDDDIYALPLAVIVPRICLSSA
nr:hypothetical protein Iba_chr12aCG13440 [Ipomoea batatas]